VNNIAGQVKRRRSTLSTLYGHHQLNTVNIYNEQNAINEQHLDDINHCESQPTGIRSGPHNRCELTSGPTFDFPGLYHVEHQTRPIRAASTNLAIRFTLVHLRESSIKATERWSVTKVKCCRWSKGVHLRTASILTRLLSLPPDSWVRFLVQFVTCNATGLPPWCRVSDTATAEASHSATNGVASSVARKLARSILLNVRNVS